MRITFRHIDHNSTLSYGVPALKHRVRMADYDESLRLVEINRRVRDSNALEHLRVPGRTGKFGVRIDIVRINPWCGDHGRHMALVPSDKALKK